MRPMKIRVVTTRSVFCVVLLLPQVIVRKKKREVIKISMQNKLIRLRQVNRKRTGRAAEPVIIAAFLSFVSSDNGSPKGRVSERTNRQTDTQTDGQSVSQ